MSRKRGKKHKAAVPAVPEDILAEGSGPVREVAAGAIATVEDVVTTADIATTQDVVTADDVVATAEDRPVQRRAAPGADADGDDAIEAAPGEPPAGDVAGDLIVGDPGEAAELEVAADVSNDEGSDADASDAIDAIDDDSLDAGAAEPGAEGEAGDGDDDDIGVVFPTSAATMDAVQLKHLVEALIFAADRPLTVQRLRQLTRVGDVRRLEQALVALSEDYRERGLILQQVSGGYQFRTRTQFSAWVQQLIAGRPVRLSRAQLETLAIIAYRQPITRPEIDDIRGVDSSATLKLLIDRMLIRVLGKREEVGRPMLYGTTKEFLDFFSLGDLRELPTLREYSELTAESRKVMSDRLGIAPDGSDGNGGGGGEGGGSGGDGSGGPGDGGDGGGGMIPGFDDGGSISDGGEAPANASATDLADAVATFLSAAEAVDRSSAAAVAEPDDREPADDLAGDDAGDDPAHDDAEAAPIDRVDSEAFFVAAEAGYDDDPEAVQVDDGSGDAVVTAAPGSPDDPLVADAVDHGAAYADHEADVVEPAAVEAVEATAVEAVEAAAVEAVEAAAVEAVEAAAVEAVEAAAVEAAAVEVAAVEAAAVEAVEAAAVDVAAVEAEAVLAPVASSDEGARSLVETLLDATASLHEPAALDAEGPVEVDAQLDGNGQVDGDAAWPAGSQRFSVIAPIDDRPVERPVMDSNVIGAGVLDDSDGEPAASSASNVEPAAE